MKKILVVDDEMAIRQLITYNLQHAGYQVEEAADGQLALSKAATGEFDFVVLDLMLPKLDGIEVTKRLREQNIEVPILILTAKHEEADKIIGLELGADDYMTKPFSPRELLARVKAILRRSESMATTKATVVYFGDVSWELDRHHLVKNGSDLNLTKKEYELLKFLVANRQKVVTRDQIMTNVWQTQEAVISRMVDIQISHLRDKIEPDPKQPQFLLTVRGYGYRLEVSHIEK
ncbi:Alkaline phosphatase synthesis two-component response regulator [Lapidilactobacillus dextrinicus DSM 20335]|uniref:Alkaline phosphatase synthesis two-component response regulator n=1 Tax=Lapidilactobacillus dextrinicus DSM 20335 TaxID=1423738 RepID=A0A0R2BKU2_9LACO|nr:response regulator transcription factor [Lapidilactobacillus dextrinicus]KRM79959.1 Alkaline phosphatase synthesis two-component response regulator [Lapidilactobacillus dextrinicus DSM 20335]QFG46264.1 response regulator transcription factor [Lapidilactobacillus dextrinicus]